MPTTSEYHKAAMVNIGRAGQAPVSDAQITATDTQLLPTATASAANMSTDN